MPAITLPDAGATVALRTAVAPTTIQLNMFSAHPDPVSTVDATTPCRDASPVALGCGYFGRGRWVRHQLVPHHERLRLAELLGRVPTHSSLRQRVGWISVSVSGNLASGTSLAGAPANSMTSSWTTRFPVMRQDGNVEASMFRASTSCWSCGGGFYAAVSPPHLRDVPIGVGTLHWSCRGRRSGRSGAQLVACPSGRRVSSSPPIRSSCRRSSMLAPY